MLVSAATVRLFTICLSDAILEEYREVLTRKQFQLPPELVARFLSDLEQAGQKVTPQETLSVARDPDDNKFLECAVEAGASYVITGNRRHFPHRFGTVRVVTPREFFAVLILRLAAPSV
jgi:putative PIN family toxin of toxin-antitoxin system